MIQEAQLHCSYLAPITYLLQGAHNGCGRVENSEFYIPVVRAATPPRWKPHYPQDHIDGGLRTELVHGELVKPTPQVYGRNRVRGGELRKVYDATLAANNKCLAATAV